MTDKIKCPSCKGSGKVKGGDWEGTYTDENIETVRREAGSDFVEKVMMKRCSECRGKGEVWDYGYKTSIIW